MRAILYDAYGPLEGLRLADVPLPTPRRGELRVRVTRAALNPKDALFRKGRFRVLSGGRFPKRCGQDFAGVVEDSRSPDFRAGQRVFGMLDEWAFQRGSLADYLVCRPGEAALLPDGVTDEAGAAVALVGLTALQALRDQGRVDRGTRVLIHGASGGVGTVAIQLARWLGGVVHTTSSPRNFDLCSRLGAEQTWDHGTDALARSAPRFDVVFDVFGNLGLAASRAWLAPRGVFISTVPTLGRVVKDVLTRVLAVQERLVVVRPRRRDLEQLGALLAGGRLEAVIDARFALDRVQDAFRVLESKRARGKLVVDIAG